MLDKMKNKIYIFLCPSCVTMGLAACLAYPSDPNSYACRGGDRLNFKHPSSILGGWANKLHPRTHLEVTRDEENLHVTANPQQIKIYIVSIYFTSVFFTFKT